MPKVPFWIFIILALLHLSAFRIDTMDVDASQYAEISREMMHSDNFLQIYDRGVDYLDKPPFLFWVSAASMSVFGVNNFGYKFPSILFALFAIYATYRLARLLYNEATARMAALIFGTCQGMFLMTNDIRTDTILTACVITAIWCIKEFELKKKWYYMVGGSLSIACGMMTKGPIALLVPAFCFGSDWILKRDWKNLFNPTHLLYILLIAIFLIPMSIGLYQQFDMHPEKTVNGLQNVSGLRFFYWSQSFGRITGESPWNNGAKIDFLLVNMLWSFLPWIFLFIPAFIFRIIDLFRQKFRIQPQQEWITMGGFLLSYIALGSSRYQLPHYIFVVFPLAAIITAKLFNDLFEGKYPVLARITPVMQYAVSVLLFIGLLLILTVVFPAGIIGIVLWAFAFILWLFLIVRKGTTHKMFWSGAVAMLLVNIFLTHYFYNSLLKYQLGSQVGHFIKNENIPPGQVSAYKITDPLNTIHFYAESVIERTNDDISGATYILTTNDGLAEIKQKGYTYNILKKGVYFKVSELTPDFLNANSRHKAVTDYYFIKLI